MPKSILVVEDDQSIRDNLKFLFELEGFSVATADDGRQALDALLKERGHPPAVFLDLMMPVMDGKEFLQELHSCHPDLAREVPVILITAASLSAESEASLRPMVKDVVTKPFSVERMLELAKRYAS